MEEIKKDGDTILQKIQLSRGRSFLNGTTRELKMNKIQVITIVRCTILAYCIGHFSFLDVSPVDDKAEWQRRAESRKAIKEEAFLATARPKPKGK